MISTSPGRNEETVEIVAPHETVCAFDKNWSRRSHEFRTVIWNDYQLSTGFDVGEDEIGGLHEKLELLVHAGGFIFLNTARLTGAETRKVVHLVEIGISLTNCDRFERYLHEWNEKYKSELSKLREMKKQQHGSGDTSTKTSTTTTKANKEAT